MRILMEVAVIQMKILNTKVDKGSVAIVFIDGGVGPKRQPNGRYWWCMGGRSRLAVGSRLCHRDAKGKAVNIPPLRASNLVSAACPSAPDCGNTNNLDDMGAGPGQSFLFWITVSEIAFVILRLLAVVATRLVLPTSSPSLVSGNSS